MRRGDHLTPALVESIVLLGTLLPFAQAAAVLAHFTQVRVAAETVRRLTEAAGAVQVAIETTAVAAIEHTLPDPLAGPAVQLLSVDGAMAPLVGGEWGEVKTLALGEVVRTADGPITTALSYFSRLTDAATFGRLATLETHRRGTTSAAAVVAVTDGAVWCQGFIDLQRPDAVRVLDFPHAMEHLGAVAQAVYGPGTASASEWLGQVAHQLRHGQEDAVLTAVIEVAARPELRAEVRTTVLDAHRYLATRRDQLRYQTYVAAGYPIGSGCVESANKLVVEARLKGAGMHWARGNINPLLALRTLHANDRWPDAWPTLWRARCTTQRPAPPRAPSPSAAAPHDTAPPPIPDSQTSPAPALPRVKTIVNGKPTPDHPWKRGLPRRAIL